MLRSTRRENLVTEVGKSAVVRREDVAGRVDAD